MMQLFKNLVRLGFVAAILAGVPWLVGISRFSLSVAILIAVDVMTMAWLGPIHRPRPRRRVRHMPITAFCTMSG
jgi:hypothetical protein